MDFVECARHLTMHSLPHSLSLGLCLTHFRHCFQWTLCNFHPIYFNARTHTHTKAERIMPKQRLNNFKYGFCCPVANDAVHVRLKHVYAIVYIRIWMLAHAYAHALYGCLCADVMDRSQKLKKNKARKSFDLWTLSSLALGNRFIQFVVYAAMWHAYGKIFVSESELTLCVVSCCVVLCCVVLDWSVCLPDCLPVWFEREHCIKVRSGFAHIRAHNTLTHTHAII